MSSYSDQPQINALYVEQEQVLTALSMIEAGGTLSSFIIAGPPPPPYDPDNPSPPVPPMSPVNIFLPDPAGPEVMDQITQVLNRRSDDINAQLAALGVTGAPTRKET